MKRLVDYLTATGTNPGDLDAIVRDYLAKGWQLHGSPYFGQDSDGEKLFCQALVKYDGVC